MNEYEFRQLLAENLIFYRKRAGLTQAEVASHINYSDKSVSKWERGDGSPDVYVLTLLAALYGTDVSALSSPRVEEEAALVPDEVITEPEPEPVSRRASRSPFTAALAVGGVWLVATIIFSMFNMLDPSCSMSWLAFIYAIPASFVAMEYFAAKWKLPSIMHLLFMSGVLWTLMVSVHLTCPGVENIYLIYVIAAVAQLLGIFALGLYWQMIKWPQVKMKKRLKGK